MSTTRKEVNNLLPLNQPVYMKLRITTSEDVYDPTDEQNWKAADRGGPRRLKNLLEMLEENGFIFSKMTSGYEKKGRTGDWVKPHFHIHFNTMTKRDTIRKSITRWWFKTYEEKLSGNKMWSFQIEPYVVEDKFFCYPLKQAAWQQGAMTKGFNEEEIITMTKAANMTAAIAMEVAIKKNDKKEESDTLYDRLEVALDKGQGTIGEILTFYMEENKPINDTTIVGYYNLYRLKRNRISVAEYAEILKSKYTV